jgi:hypothetical protein
MSTSSSETELVQSWGLGHSNRLIRYITASQWGLTCLFLVSIHFETLAVWNKWNCGEKITEILRDDSTQNWQPFETVRQNKIFWHPKPQFEVGKRSTLVGLFLSLIYFSDIANNCVSFNSTYSFASLNYFKRSFQLRTNCGDHSSLAPLIFSA